MGINKQAIMDAFGFDEEDIEMLIEVYFEGATDSLNDLKEAILANNLEAIYKAAHSIKGSSANIQLDEIATLAGEIEHSGKNEEDTNYQEKYDKLYALIEDLK